ncbi:type ISP restriction/modification enzyme [Cryobacterium sp. Hb1]|uniref:type ISP restriction/modification enzyme n=1 Tax=Cryobacterium sp. Hb1 TaxID=1259147 RepID=UPI003519F359
MLPRIPKLMNSESFIVFCDAGRRLSELHLNYESVPRIRWRSPPRIDRARQSPA